MRRLGLLVSFAAVLSAAPIAANAQRAFALDGADIFAGPGSDYPIVARVAPGVGLRINGCLNDYSWCDVSFGPNRGWAYAGDLGYTYQSSRVPVIEYGPRLALPVITFSLGSYWDRYYRGRPWYRERNDWDRRYREHDFRGDYRRDYRNDARVNERRANEYRANEYRNEFRGNEYRGNENFRRDARQENRQDNNNRRIEAPRGNVEAPRGNVNERRNDARVSGSVQNDGHGGYAPRQGPNGAVPPSPAQQ